MNNEILQSLEREINLSFHKMNCSRCSKNTYRKWIVGSENFKCGYNSPFRKTIEKSAKRAKISWRRDINVDQTIVLRTTSTRRTMPIESSSRGAQCII